MSDYEHSLLPEVLELARRAGAAILQIYAQQFEVTTKDDRSPLTLADLRSHEIIVHRLASGMEYVFFC